MGHPVVNAAQGPGPRVIAWESTQACNLVCQHCRASAQQEPSSDELSTVEVLQLIDQIAALSKPIFVISGGEPLMREDIFRVAAHANERGLRVAISPNGTLITPDVVNRLQAAGVQRVSVSIDGSRAARHDAIRGVAGAFSQAVRGVRYCREGRLPFQINTTVMRQNVDDLSAIHDLTVSLGAVAWHIFMLVPTGRGRVDDELTPRGYEAILNWIYDAATRSPIPMRVTCGPQFVRLVLTRRAEAATVPNLVGHRRGLDRTSRGCLAGMGYCFISHRGEVYPCGYLPVLAGDVREEDFGTIYRESALFRELRELSRLQGKCGRCSFVQCCGGCRARAFGLTGNYLAEEPYCFYQPSTLGLERSD